MPTSRPAQMKRATRGPGGRGGPCRTSSMRRGWGSCCGTRKASTQHVASWAAGSGPQPAWAAAGPCHGRSCGR
eukprot:4268260-Pyramimonas_sp.AAC.1